MLLSIWWLGVRVGRGWGREGWRQAEGSVSYNVHKCMHKHATLRKMLKEAVQKSNKGGY